jgi:DNA (cytosine-5)-methyltransferase 1
VKGATLFSGFEGAGVGMKAAGITHAWGIEIDDKIAGVARLNGFNVHTGDVLRADPHCFERVDVLHASPPCPNFSRAKTNGKETQLDIDLAHKVADFIDVLRPSVFTLENVYQYRRSASWTIIRETLYECGYWLDLAHVNSADYGVPQTRQRMVVRALRGRMVPYLPPAERWVGWYEAIEDLIPGLPESQFAGWQLDRLPDTLSSFVIGSEISAAVSTAAKPATTITTENGGRLRAVIANSANQNAYGRIWREDTAPVFTVETFGKSAYPRAFIVDGQTNEGERLTTRFEDEPMLTVSTGTGSKRGCRAWLSHGRVVKMNSRALARFQSFPDWFVLPDKNSLACKGIGNACPPLLMEKIMRQLI